MVALGLVDQLEEQPTLDLMPTQQEEVLVPQEQLVLAGEG
jgi:hypothetical protein